MTTCDEWLLILSRILLMYFFFVVIHWKLIVRALGHIFMLLMKKPFSMSIVDMFYACKKLRRRILLLIFNEIFSCMHSFNKLVILNFFLSIYLGKKELTLILWKNFSLELFSSDGQEHSKVKSTVFVDFWKYRQLQSKSKFALK